MSTAETEPAGIDLQVLADLDAVMKRIIDGTPVDPDRITEEIRRTRGVMDDASATAAASFPRIRRREETRRRR